ncbi:MAG TPA: SUMF1/EgtB/PvdO family nonheme iron enzyme, partial [Thermoanaerobaculia bacterium]
ELLLKAYLASLANDCDYLPLGTIDTQFRDGGERRVRLPDVYVELDVTVTSRPSADDGERDWSWRLIRGEAAGRMGVGAALARPEASRHVLLGDPGSGKTTVAHHLCRALVAGGDVPEGLAGLLPVRFVLRDVAALHLPAAVRKGTAGVLWNALAKDLENRLGAAAASRLLPHLQERAMDSGAFIVLDGLDEVAQTGRRREVLLEAVADLAATLRDSPSRLLVTARPYAYADPKWHLEGFEILGLAPFRAEQVELFIEQWYMTAARQALRWTEDAARAKSELLRRALDHRPYLGDLASRPLLLTLMATLHSSWGQLPDDRADLYEETVKLLLGRWQRAREGEGGEEESLSQLLRVPERRLREALEALAFTVHERQGADPERDEQPADISDAELLQAFRPLLDDVGPAELLGYLENRAGVLIHRRAGVYAFPHRSFQEYLAACHLGGLPDPMDQFRQRAFADPAWWREVVLLGIGRARRSGLGTAVGFVSTLMPDGPDSQETIDDVHWRVAVLCGEALLELPILGTEKAEEPQYRAIVRRARDWLVRLVEEGRLSPKERVKAGDVLGRLGDPRPGVEAVDWLEVPAGPFVIGSADADPLAYDDERPQHEVYLERFWISRYPVTNAQFRPFVEDDGYSNRDYWTEDGREWLQGAEPDGSFYPEDWREQMANWFAKRPKEKRRRPFFWDHERLSAPTRPVVGVTWHEACAFCRWLTAHLGEQGGTPVVGVQCGVSLPTEAQWEKAARGTQGLLWPWSNEFDAKLCNSEENEVGEPSPVGIFPGDSSPFGARDVVGNVWEWTSTAWGRAALPADYEYPYVADDGRENRSSRCGRILRGGSFYNDKRDARCAARLRVVPEDFFDFVGFRVVLSLAHSES